jgi:hypothetical protein
MAVQIFSQNNASLQVAPPAYHIPNDTGVPVPANHKVWVFLIDTGGTVPAGQPFALVMEFLHSDGWHDDSNGQWVTGPHTPKGGPSTTVIPWSSTFGSVDSNGNLIGEYPQRARVRVEQAGNWTLPNVTLNLI